MKTLQILLKTTRQQTESQKTFLKSFMYFTFQFQFYEDILQVLCRKAVELLALKPSLESPVRHEIIINQLISKLSYQLDYAVQ